MKRKILMAGVLMGALSIQLPALEKITVPGLPDELAASVIYYHDFNQGGNIPAVNSAALKVGGKAEIATKDGLNGSCCAMVSGSQFITAEGSPVNPAGDLTYSGWFKLPESFIAQGGGKFISITGGKSYISFFCRGGHDGWLGLKDTATVFQVQNVKAISNVNRILDRNFREHFIADTWHNVVITVSRGAEIRCYIDGQKVDETILNGRTISEQDMLRTVSWGAYWSQKIFLDDLLMLNKALSDEEVRNYYEKREKK